ncbi:MAG TPA: PA14 domain-containing protein, partial [Acidimicrobiales bacterium]|nr:PA14 domain-containing protein [Acidimicrobiales bacterium]
METYARAQELGAGLDAATAAGVAPTGPGAQRLVVAVDGAWLADQAAGDEPVVVDPPISLVQMCQYGIDESGSCDGLSTGTWDPSFGNWWRRSVAQWNYRPAVETNDILYAGVWMNEYYIEGRTTTDPELINLWQATGWSAAGAVANGDPAYWIDNQISQVGGCSPFADVCFDVTETLRNWQLNGVFNGWWDGKFGFAPDEADYPGFLQRNSFKQYTAESTALVMNLNARTPAPNLTAPADGALAVGTQAPAFSWDPVTDPDGDPIRYVVKVATGTDGESGVVASSPELTTTSWTVPDGVLRDGVTYYWKVFAYDGHAWTPSGVRKLTVDQRLGLGGVSPADGFGGVSTNLVTGAPTLKVTAPDMPTVGGGIGVDFTYDGRPARTGLVGTYREDKNRNHAVDSDDAVKLVRSDAQIAFDWGAGSPSPAVPVDGFQVTWRGRLRTPAGNWQIGVVSDDGVRVWGDDTKILDYWAGVGTVEYQSGQVSNDRTHEIQIDYYEDSNGAFLHLWARNKDNQAQAFVVPADWLSPEIPEMPAGWSLQAADMSAYYIRAAVSEGSIALTGADGATYSFSKQPDGSYKAPEGIDDIVSLAGDGRVVVHDDVGYSYDFWPDGGLRAITSALDDTHPAAATNHFDGDGHLDRITDPVSGRSVELVYAAQDNDDSRCPDAPSGKPAGDFGSVAGMLCKVNYWDGTSTDLYYLDSSELLAYVANPGEGWWAFAYDAKGRLSAVSDPLANDALRAGVRADDDGLFTKIAYEDLPPPSVYSRVQKVTAPKAQATDTERAERTYGYEQVVAGGLLSGGSATVSRAGDPPGTLYRTVAYDYRGRPASDTNSVGQITRSYWNIRDLQVATVSPDGLMTATFYDNRRQPTHVWGPAPEDQFKWETYGPSQYPSPKDQYAAQIPTARTYYDEGITGVQARWWEGLTFGGPPKAHAYDEGLLRDDDAARPAGIPADGAAARYSGDITFPTAGVYKMQLCLGPNDVAWLYIDGRLTVVMMTPTTEYGCSTIDQFGTQFRAYGNGEKHTVQVDYLDFSGADRLHLNWVRPDGVYDAVTGLTAAYGSATSTVDPDGKVTQTSYVDAANGIGPQYGLATRTVVDPAGLALTNTTTYETPGATNSYLRPTAATLPAEATGESTRTTKDYYGGTQVVDNPCGTEPANGADDDFSQGGMLKLDTAADPDGSGSQTPIERETVYDRSVRPVASRVGSEPWTC